MEKDRTADLLRAVDRLSIEARDLRLTVSRKTRAIWVAMIVGSIAVMVLMGGMITVLFDNTEAIERNNQKLCPMVGLMIRKPSDPPITSERGRVVAQRAVELYKSYNC